VGSASGATIGGAATYVRSYPFSVQALLAALRVAVPLLRSLFNLCAVLFFFSTALMPSCSGALIACTRKATSTWEAQEENEQQ